MIKLLSLFSGIGAFEEALKNLNIAYELVNYCECKPAVAKAYSLIHNEPITKNLGDITKVNEKALPDFDLMTYGFPCQDISILGNRKGFFNEDGSLTRSGLFYEAMRIAKHKKPKYLIAENVMALATHKKMKPHFESVLATLDEIGYNSYHKVLTSKDFGIPHSRNRVFIISIRKDLKQEFEFPAPVPLTKKASDLYDSGEINDRYYLKKENVSKYISDFKIKRHYSSVNKDVILCMNTHQGGLSNSQNFVKDEKGYRTFTDKEMFAFQGFKKEYGTLLTENGFSMPQIGFMCGNSITVQVLEAIFAKLLLE